MSRYGYPAQYNGEYFDSQTEAAWAAYFDAVNIEWEREPETFELFPGDYYTPDYYVSTWDSYLEVKNGNADEDTYMHLGILARKLGKATILAHGKPHNLFLEIFSPKSFNPNIEDRRGVSFKINNYSLGTRRIYEDNKLKRTETVPIDEKIFDAYSYSDTAYSIQVDPEVREASKNRKRELRYNRRVFMSYAPTYQIKPDPDPS